MATDIPRTADSREPHKQALTKNRQYLSDNLVFDFVESRLLHNEVITERMKQVVEAPAENFKKIRKLIDILITLPRGKFDLFCQACRDDDYEHVAENLEETCRKLSGVSDQSVRTVDHLREYLEDNIYMDVIMPNIVSVGVVSERAKEGIEALQLTSDKIDKLIETIAEAPAEKLPLFCEECRRCGYEHVANMIKRHLPDITESIQELRPLNLRHGNTLQDIRVFPIENMPEADNFLDTVHLTELMNRFETERKTFAALYGIHGAGKTQLAYRFGEVLQEKGDLQVKWVFNAASEETLYESIQELLKELKKNESSGVKINSLVAKLLSSLREYPRSYLVFDDVVSATKKYVEQFKSGLKQIKIVTTTNNANLYATQDAIEVLGFTDDEILNFLREDGALSEESDEALLHLGHTLDKSPLGLRIAKAYIGNYYYTVKDYLERFAEDEESSTMSIEHEIEDEITDYIGSYNRNCSFLKALTLSIDRIKANIKDEHLFQVFELFAYFDPKYIPYNLLVEAYIKGNKNINAGKADSKIRILLKQLNDASISVGGRKKLTVNDPEGSLSIHSGVQVAMRWRWDVSEKMQVLQRLVRLLFPYLRRHIVYQSDFMYNDRLTSVMAPELKKCLRRQPKVDTSDTEYALMLIHVLDAMAMTLLYQGHCGEDQAEWFAEEARKYCSDLLGINTDMLDEPDTHRRRPNQQVSVESTRAAQILEKIETAITSRNLDVSFIERLNSLKRYTEQDYGEVWRRKLQTLPLLGSKIDSQVREVLQKHRIFLKRNDLPKMYLAELFMSVMYTVGRTLVYRIRKRDAPPKSTGHYYELLLVAWHMGCQMTRETGIDFMYTDRIKIKGLHSLDIAGIIPDENRKHVLEQVITKSIEIAKQEKAFYEFGALFRFQGYTNCSFTLYSYRQAIDGYIKLLGVVDEMEKEKIFTQARILLSAVNDLLKKEKEEFLCRGTVLSKAGALLSLGRKDEDLDQAWEYYVAAMETEKHNDKWNYSLVEGLKGLTKLVLRQGREGWKDAALGYIQEYVKTLSKRDDALEELSSIEDLRCKLLGTEKES